MLSDLDLIFQICENLLPIKEILYECDLWISIFKPHASLYDVFGKYELTNNLKSVLAYLEHKERLDKLSKAFSGYDLNLLNDDNLAKNVDKTCKPLQEILSLENHANALKKTFGTFQFNLQTVRNLLANYLVKILLKKRHSINFLPICRKSYYLIVKMS